jgi:tetratricopeptide (TPR) repeat protein
MFLPLSNEETISFLLLHKKTLKSFFVLFVVLIIFSTVGCGTHLQPQWTQSRIAIPRTQELKTVPFYPQKRYQCGPATLAMVLGWSGNSGNLSRLSKEVYTPALQGSLQPALIAAARRHGRIAYPITKPQALLIELAAGHPVLVLQNLGLSWFPVWHYAIVVGYDLEEGIMILHSGVTPFKKISLKVFDNTWSGGGYWGLLVLPPTLLPETAHEEPFIEAVLGLEKARQWQAAISGYRTALRRWPENRYAMMGLGHSYYQLGHLRSAEFVFRKAVRKFPTEGAAFNNLAQVLREQGKKSEALKAAQQAVNLGGSLIEVYRKTLKDIQETLP